LGNILHHGDQREVCQIGHQAETGQLIWDGCCLTVAPWMSLALRNEDSRYIGMPTPCPHVQIAVLSAFLGPDQAATEAKLAADPDFAPWVKKYQNSRETVSQTDYEVS